MIRKMVGPAGMACAVVALLLGALTLGPYMHETDQGWLLDGGIAVAKGNLAVVRADFNFDKQFISYLLAGGVIRLLPRPLSPDMVVLAGNICAMVLFWGSLLLLLARSQRRLPLAAAVPMILTPAFLEHSPFYASAFVSAAFLLLLAALLDRKRCTLTDRAGIFALAFCAVGARADGILLLPLLAMLHSPRRTMVSVVRAPNTWIMAAAGLAAFFLGRQLYMTGYLDDFAEFPFRLKQLLVCLAFGLGGGCAVLLVIFHAVWRMRFARGCPWWTGYLIIGLAIPLGYYCPQMLSPRHSVVGAVTVLVFLGAPAGRAILDLYFRGNRFGRAVKIALVLAAVAPVLVGLDISDSHRPRLTVAHPTLLPSHAGVFPVGAYLGNAVNFRRQHGFIDHNQGVWKAAEAVTYQASAEGIVPLIATPMQSYFFLCIRLQGKTPRPYTLGLETLPPNFYVDSRSLMRFAYEWAPERMLAESFFGQEVLTPATTVDWHGITVMHGDNGTPLRDDSLCGSLWVLNVAFAGDEFRLESAESLPKIPRDWAGKKLVVASRGRLSLLGAQTEEITSALLGRWYFCSVDALQAGAVLAWQTSAPDKIFVATSVFPEWISLRKF